MTDADKRIEALIERAGCPMMVVKNTEQKSFEDVRRSILRVADEQYDGSLIEYIRDLTNTIDRMEGALENVIIERDAALAKVPKWISVEERLPENADSVLIRANGRVEKTIWEEAYALAIYGSEGWFLLDYEDADTKYLKISHWMPLPEPPEKQKDTKGD